MNPRGNSKEREPPSTFDSSLCGSQTSDGYAEGRAGDVVQADLMAELNGDGVAAVLAADTDVHGGTDSLALGINGWKKVGLTT